MRPPPLAAPASIVVEAELIEEIAALAHLWSGELRGRRCPAMDLRALARRVGRVSVCRR